VTVVKAGIGGAKRPPRDSDLRRAKRAGDFQMHFQNLIRRKFAARVSSPF
jgi:hypothetical protein